MRTSRKTDFRLNKDFRSSKNNFRGHDISQGLDRVPPSLSPHFLLLGRNSKPIVTRGLFLDKSRGLLAFFFFRDN